MRSRRNLWTGVIATTSLLLLTAGLATTAAFSIQPPEQDRLSAMELRHPDLWYGNVFRPLAGLPVELSRGLASDLGRLGVDPGNAYFDLRTARWGTLIVTRPLIPGPGVRNDLEWSDLGRQEPRGPEALKQAAWEAFRAFLAVHADELSFDLDELAEPTVSILTPHMIRIHVGREHGGVAVRDSFVTAAINSGNLVLVGQRNWANLIVETTPSLAGDRAEEALRSHLEGIGYERLRESPRLEIVPVSDQPDEALVTPGEGLQFRLVWVLEPLFEGDLGSWEALVDAHTGELVAFENRDQHLSRRVEGAIFPVSNDGQGDDGTLQFGYPMPFADISLDGSPIGFTSTGGNVPPGADAGTISTILSGQFIRMNDTCGAVNESVAAGDLDLDGVPLPGTDCNVPAGHSAGDTNASRSGFYELNRLKEQARGYLPDNTWLQGQLTANMNINQNCNAFWSNTNFTVNFYTSGGGCSNTGEIAAIFDHEWGHGMDFFNGASGISRPGEGIADIFAQNRLLESCIGRNFRPGVQCGGYGDPCLDCTGVRDVDYAKRQSGLPHDVSFILSNCTGTGNTPCGRGTHCEGSTVSESVWDLVHRDLMGFEGSPFNLDLNTALELGTRLSYHGSNNVVNWYQCVTDGTGGCNADSGYLGYLAADDDDGDLTNGTPHMSAIFAAFNRHQIACPTPVVQDFGCAGAPTAAPTNLATTPFDEGMELTWDPVPDAVEYQIFRTEGVHGCEFGKALVGSTTDTSFTETGLRNGFELLYSVVAVGASDACTSPMSTCLGVIPVAGPSGTLNGTVTNSVTTAPLQGVTIEAVGPVALGGVTLADGTYQIAAPVGTYDVTASMEGFFPQTVTGVEVTEGGTFTNDFALVPLPQTADITPESFSFEVFEGQSDGDTLNIGNIGNIDLTWSIAEAETDCGTPSDVTWLSADPVSGVTPPFSSVPVSVTADSTGLAPGLYEARFCVTTDDPDAPLVEVPVSFNVLATPVIDIDPDAITVTVEAGTTHMETLTVNNLGSATLDWTILLDGGLRGLSAPLSGRRPVTLAAPGAISGPLAATAGVPGEAVSPEVEAAAEAGIDRSVPAAKAAPPRASGLSGGELLLDGALLVPNTTANFIVALDPETGDVLDPEFISIAGTSGARNKALLHPDGERVLMTSQTQDVVHAFSVADGSYLGVFAPAGGVDTNIMNNIRGMAFHPATGQLLVTSADAPAPDRVVEFDLDGNFVGVFIDGAADGLGSPWDLLFRESDVLVTNGIDDGTLRYDHDGNFLGVFESMTDFPKQIVQATNGNILVSTLSNGLWEFDANGGVVANYAGVVTSQNGHYELPNLDFLVTGSSGGSGVHEITRDNVFVETKISGTSYMVQFAKSLDCTIPEWLTVSPTSGSTEPAGSTPVTVTIDTTLLGLGEHTAGICFESNDPVQPIVQVPVTLNVIGEVPIADISPSSFEIDLPVGGSQGATLNVGNIGLLDLVWSIDEADSGAGCASPVDIPWLSATPTEGTTAPSESVPVDVTVDAAGLLPGVFEAALCVTTNDPDAPLVPVPVTLTVLGPTADVSPQSFAFEVFEGGSASDVLNVGNLGTSALDWNSEEAEADCASPLDVPWLSAAPTAGTTPPQGSVPVDVTVVATSLTAGTYTAQLCVTTNDPEAPLVAVPVQLSVLAAAVIDVVPESLAVTIELDGSAVEELEVHNVGSTTLDWTILLDTGLRGVNSPMRGTRSTGGLANPSSSPEQAQVAATAFAPIDPETIADEEAGIDRSQATARHAASRITGAARNELLQDGALLVPQPGTAQLRIVALDPETGAVLDPDFINYSDIGTLGTLQHILLHPDGERLLMASQGQNVVHAFSVDGEYLGVFAPAGGADTGIMSNLRGMAFHPDTGNLLVTAGAAGHHSVVEFDQEGNHLGVFIEGGSGGISGPWSIQFRDDDVLVSASAGNIYRYARGDGTFLSVWNADINFPEQIVEIDSGNILAAAFSSPSGAWELDPDGNQLAIYGPLTGLRGVYELPSGNIMVSNSGGIHEINRNGELVETKLTGSTYMYSFIKTLDCSIPEWLSVNPTAGSTDPGSFDTVTVSFDATGLAPGEYTAGICFESNDPEQPILQVPVTLTVTLPGNFATVEGTVQSLGYCGDEVTALDGAMVEIAGAASTYTLETDGNGFYQAFLPDSESPLDITVSAAGHHTATVDGITFVGGDIVVQDFDLELDAPCATADPASFGFELEENESATETLTIGNVAGGADLTWTIATAEPPAVAGSGSFARRLPSGAGAGATQVGSDSGGAAAMDIASVLGEPLPGLHMISPAAGVVDCDGEPGIVIHDDGTVENGYGGNPDVVNQVIFADRFTPDTYPASFRSVCVAFITLAGGPTTLDFDVVVFDDDGASGSPGTELGSLSVSADGIPQITPPIPPGLAPVWFSYDISSLGISVDSGSVYIGVRYAPTVPVNVFAASDQSTDRPVGFAGGQWWNDNANVWAPIQIGFPAYRSLMVRAVQSVIDCDNPTDIPWLSVAPTSGSTPTGGTSEVQVSVDSTGLAPGEYSAGLCLASNDPVKPLIVVPVNLDVVGPPPIVDISPAAFEFEVDAGGSGAQTMNIGNLGPSALLWNLDEAEGGCASSADVPWLSSDPSAGTTPGGGSVPVEVTVDTTGLGSGVYTAQLCVASNDPLTPLVEVPVQLTVIAAAIAVDPASLSSTLPEGGAETQELTVSNPGNATLTWEVTEGDGGGTPSGNPRAHFPAVPWQGAPSDDPDVRVGPDAAYAGGREEIERTANLLPLEDGVPAYTTTGFNVVGYVTFEATDPSMLTVINPSQPTNVYAATFIGNDFGQEYMLASDGGTVPLNTFGTIDTSTGVFTAQGTVTGGPAGGTWTSMKWDHTSGTLYASNVPGAGNNQLFTIDPVTLQATLVGAISGPGVDPAAIVISIAVSPEGLMYGIDIAADVLLAIDKTSGEAAVIGPLGPNANFAQDMDFDQSSGVLYWAGYQGSGNSQMFTVDTETGQATSLGNVAGGSELLSFSVAVAGVDPVDCTLPGWVSVDPASGSVVPGGSQVVDVTFKATGLDQGEYEASLCLASNDPLQPRTVVPLSLTVGEPQPVALELDPTALDFGDVPVGETSPPQASTLSNVGSGDATGLDFDLSGSADFEVDVSDCGNMLPAGQSCAVFVTFTPTQAGPAAATLSVGSDQGASASLELSGEGVGPSEITLTAVGYKVRGFHTVDLFWQGASSSEIDVWRDGTLIVTVPNDGEHTDSTGRKGRATYVYQVCEAGTSVCSNEVTVRFGGN